MKSNILIAFLVFSVLNGLAQTVETPNSALKSHETLDIVKIVLTPERTEVYLRVENRISGGSFCADRQISLVYPDGTKLHLLSSNGIPVCPDTYSFRNIGERLDFVLFFPPLRNGTGSVDLLEECDDYCFSFYGIVLDNDLNKKIDEFFAMAEHGEPAKALVGFSRLADSEGAGNQGAAGLLCLNLVKLYWWEGNRTKAGEWYRKLEASGLPQVKLYLAHLNSQGITF